MMERYRVVVKNHINAYILDKKENTIITLCNTKRPDLGFRQLEKMVKKANEYCSKLDELKELNSQLTFALKQLYDNWGKLSVEQYEYCILEDARKVLEKIKK